MQVFNGIPLAGFLFILIFLIGRIQFLKRKGIKVSSGPVKMKKPAFLLYFFFMAIFLIWLFEITNPVFHFSFSILPGFLTHFLVDSIFLKISGAAIVLTALVLLATTLLHFKTSLRFGLNENNPGKLITTGIFSISRNPFFLSLDLYFLGIALIFPSLFFIGFAVLSIVNIHFFILKEEKFLRKVYDEVYKKYTKNVGRYLWKNFLTFSKKTPK